MEALLNHALSYRLNISSSFGSNVIYVQSNASGNGLMGKAF